MIALKCPVCGNPVDAAIDGGCSKRCDDIFHGVEEMTTPDQIQAAISLTESWYANANLTKERARETGDDAVFDNSQRHLDVYETILEALRVYAAMMGAPKLTLDVVRSFDGRTCIYLEDTRIAGGKPAIGKNLIDSWSVKSSDLVEILRQAKGE